MEASVLDLRRRMGDIVRALDRNEPVTIFYRGKKKGIVYPAGRQEKGTKSVMDHPAFGMWKDRKDLDDVEVVVRSLREGRVHAL